MRTQEKGHKGERRKREKERVDETKARLIISVTGEFRQSCRTLEVDDSPRLPSQESIKAQLFSPTIIKQKSTEFRAPRNAIPVRFREPLNGNTPDRRNSV